MQQMRTIDERLAELRQITDPTPEDFARLWSLAEDMHDRIEDLRDKLEEEIGVRTRGSYLWRLEELS